MFFLAFSKIEFNFAKQKFILSIYILKLALLTIKQVQKIEKKKFAVIVLDLSKKYLSFV